MSKKRVFTPGRPHAAILRALLRYQYLTSDQTARLLYSLRYTQGKYKELVAADYVLPILISERATRAGSSPYVFTLAANGLQYLAAQGLEVPARNRRSEQRRRSPGFLYHTLAINDWLISLALLARRTDALTIDALLHERALKRRRVVVTVASGSEHREQHVAVIPDAWVDLRVEGGERYRASFALEVDRDTEEQKAWRRRVAARVAWARGPYQQAFGSPALQILVWAAQGGVRRRDQLQRWTEAELTRLGATASAELFLFAEGDAAVLAPEALLCTPRWLAPFSAEPVALLEGLV